MTDLDYQRGFGNEHQSEAVEGVVPEGQNSPRHVAHGLYAEQLSGTAFTAPRHRNQRSWLYRIRPSVRHLTGLRPIDQGELRSAPCHEADPVAEQLRWSPQPLEGAAGRTFISGLVTVATNGDANLQVGAATHLYVADRSMIDEVFVNGDGEMLIVPETGALRLVTEFGLLDVTPGEIVIIPRGVKFRVEMSGAPARGYVCENYGAAFALPEPGLVGVNALAMPRDFRYPVAAYDTADRPTRMVMKSAGRLFAADLDHSPLDVVGWHGNLAPYKYALRDYCPVGPVLFDHPDPSLWTVLTSPSDTAGVANVDFVLFRERWLVSEHTFRPPWFHSNVMSEVMGIIEGTYDAKLDGFAQGALSIHNAFLPHGPDHAAFVAGTGATDDPVKMDDMLSFMFESRYQWRLTTWALASPTRQHDYASHWADLDRTTDL